MLKLNVGFNKKVGDANYGSHGASVNLDVELDGGLINDTDRLKERIHLLFALAKASVENELSGHSVVATNGHTANGNGQSNRRQRDATRKATASQVRALHAIAQRNHLDVTNIIQSRYGLDTPEDLTITAASALIDDLKGTRNGKGGN